VRRGSNSYTNLERAYAFPRVRFAVATLLLLFGSAVRKIVGDGQTREVAIWVEANANRVFLVDHLPVWGFDQNPNKVLTERNVVEIERVTLSRQLA
jgi:hypothetical protein